MENIKKVTLYTIWIEQEMCEEKIRTQITFKSKDEAKKCCEYLNKRYLRGRDTINFYYEKENKRICKDFESVLPVLEQSDNLRDFEDYSTIHVHDND